MERTALLNRTRGLLAEFAMWIGRSSAVLIRQLPQLAQDEQLPEHFRHCQPFAADQMQSLRQGALGLDQMHLGQ